MSHSVDSLITQLPLPERSPTLLLSQHGSVLRRLVSQIKERHPDWAPETVRRMLFKQGLTAPLADLYKIMREDEALFRNMLPLRLVKARLGLWK